MYIRILFLLTECTKKNAGVINFIEKNGRDSWLTLKEPLDRTRPIKAQLNALAIKGHVFSFDNYNQCYDACRMLFWSFDQIEAFAIVFSRAFNWENESVQRTIEKMMTIDENKIRENINQQFYIILNFSKNIYREISA